MASAPAEAVTVVQPVVGEAQQLTLGGMQETLSGACPDCGSQLEFAEGCVKCHVCGYSECG
jgi:ribonucleoside-diphosphate reductase alpha chain